MELTEFMQISKAKHEMPEVLSMLKRGEEMYFSSLLLF